MMNRLLDSSSKILASSGVALASCLAAITPMTAAAASSGSTPREQILKSNDLSEKKFFSEFRGTLATGNHIDPKLKGDASSISELVRKQSHLLDLIYSNPSDVPNYCRNGWNRECIKHIRKISKESPAALYVLSIIYIDGTFVDEDEFLLHQKIGLSMLANAAEKDYPNAENLLGHFMLTGAPRILQKDRFKAETLFQSAASKGYLAAKINLAILMVSNGKGNEAFSIINDVKDQSHDAAVLYGLMKTHGIGVEQNLQEARSVFGRLSSDFALYNYSVFMFHGLGGEKNISQAMSNFEKLSDTKRGLPFIAASKNIEYFRSISNRTEYGNGSPTLASSKSVANQVGAQNNIDSVASMLRCHMDGCSYVKFLKSYDKKIPSSNGGVLSKVAVRVVEKNYGYSSHKNGDYPKSIREARNIQWSNKLSVSYFICDKSFPAVISEVENHPSGNKFSTDYIAFLDVSGYNVSTIQEYIKACHSKDIDVENFSYNKEGYKSFLKRLGYDDYFGWGVANYSTKNSPDLQSALKKYLSAKQEAPH